jgi:hypothetical protein
VAIEDLEERQVRSLKEINLDVHFVQEPGYYEEAKIQNALFVEVPEPFL